MTIESPTDPHLSFEDARDQLLQVVARLEAGNVSLAEAMSLWERGEELARICQTQLDGARDRVAASLNPQQPPADPSRP